MPITVYPPPASLKMSGVATLSGGAVFGYRGPQACAAAGISYRQLDYWCRTGLAVPSLRSARGSGTHRLYSYTDLLRLAAIKRLLDAGMSLQSVRRVMAHLDNVDVAALDGRALVLTDHESFLTTMPELADLLADAGSVFHVLPLAGLIDDVDEALDRFDARRSARIAGSPPPAL